MVIQACPRCGCSKLEMPGFEDGVVPETDNLNEYVCTRCDLKAIPIEFESRDDHAAFEANAEWPER